MERNGHRDPSQGPVQRSVRLLVAGHVTIDAAATAKVGQVSALGETVMTHSGVVVLEDSVVGAAPAAIVGLVAREAAAEVGQDIHLAAPNVRVGGGS